MGTTRKAVSKSREDALYVGSLEKGFRVLYAFAQHGSSLGLSEIAERTGFHMSMAQRFTHTLHRLGFLAKDEASRRYRLTPKMMDFSFLYLRADALSELAAPYMLELGEHCDETVNLSQLDGFDTISVARMPRRGVRSLAPVGGARRPAFCTSSGRVLLADLAIGDARRIVDGADRMSLTPKTITKPGAVMKRIAVVRTLGYSIVEDEFISGEISIAAPIYDVSGRAIAAINVPVPTTRWSADTVEKTLMPLLLETARAISRAKGAATAYS